MNNRKITALFFNLVLALALAITTLPAQAAVPQTLNYQGQLTNAAGVPVNSGLAGIGMTFKLYDAATAGNLLWTEPQTVVVSNGLYSVTLGKTTPLTPALFGVPLYLGIAVGADAEMTPRIAMSSSATALRAAVADMASSVNCTGCLTTSNIAPGAVTAGNIAAGSISSSLLASGSVTAAQLAAGAVTTSAISAGAITAAQLAPGAVATSWTDGTGKVTTAVNVGVGTVAPVVNAKLDVQGGAINIGGTGNADAALHIKSSFGGFDRLTQIHPTAASKPGLNLMASTNSAAAAQWWVWGPDSGNIWRIQPGIGFSGSTGLFIDNTGNVGVGTTTPAATLHVVGSVNIPGNSVQTAADTSNTLLGVGAGNATMTGTKNTASGGSALSRNTTGSYNTASGMSALYSNTTGGNNTASGMGALYSNTTGGNNTASGNAALISNTTGSSNTASGVNALFSNFTGGGNTASGKSALYSNTTGYYNTASGGQALLFNTTGSSNTASGSGALLYNTTGNYNTAIGDGSGYNLTTGNYNIDIGNMGVAAEANTIRIGDANQTRTFIAGIRGVTTGAGDAIPVVIDSSGQLGTVSSSRRFKDDIADMSEASSLLMKLRPVTFTYKADKSPERALQYGLIAEEVAEIAPRLVAHSADGQIETVFYQFLTPMLLNEYQKQQRTIEMQTAALEAQKVALARQAAHIAELDQARKEEMAALKAENAKQKDRLARMESQVQLLLAQVQAGEKLASR